MMHDDTFEQRWAHPDAPAQVSDGTEQDWVLTFDQTSDVLDVWARLDKRWREVDNDPSKRGVDILITNTREELMRKTAHDCMLLLYNHAPVSQMRAYVRSRLDNNAERGGQSDRWWRSDVFLLQQMLDNARPGGFNEMMQISERWNSRVNAQKALTAGGHLDVDDIVPSDEELAGLLAS